MLIGPMTNNASLRSQSDNNQSNAALNARFTDAKGNANPTEQTSNQPATRTTQATGNLSLEEASRNLDALAVELDSATTARDAAQKELQSQQQTLDEAEQKKRNAQEAFVATSEAYQALEAELLTEGKTIEDLSTEELNTLNTARQQSQSALQAYNTASANFDTAKTSFDATATRSATLDADVEALNEQVQTGIDELTLAVLGTVLQTVILEALTSGFNNANLIANAMRFDDYS